MKIITLLVFLACTNIIIAQSIMNIGLEVAELTPTQKVYNVYVKNYTQILASQYSMVYDAQKMTFKSVRNSIPDGLGNDCFGTPYAGSLTHVWLQSDLNPGSYSDSTVIYQLVFNVLQPGGSTLCFTDTPLAYEFVMPDEDIVSPFYIHDDCFSGNILVDPVAGTHQPKIDATGQVKQVALFQNGKMTFTLDEPRNLGFMLMDASGKEITASRIQFFPAGRSTVSFGHTLTNEIYLIKAQGPTSGEQTIKVFAK